MESHLKAYAVDRSVAREGSNLAAAAALVVAGSVVFGPVGTVVAGIGTEMLAGLAERGWAQLRDRLLGDQGLLDDQLQAAMRRAYVKAVRHLEKLWWATPRGNQQQRDRDQREAVAGMFVMLRQDGEQILTAGRLREFAGDAEAIHALGTEPGTAARAVDGPLAVYLLGHDEQLAEFLRKNLVPELARAFAAELQAQTPEGTGAWRAYQRLVAESLMAGITSLQAAQQLAQDRLRDLADAFERLQTWTERLEALPNHQRDPTGESGLAEAIADSRNQIIGTVVAESGLTREAVTQAFDGTLEAVAAAEERIRADISALRPDDLERLRQHTSATLDRTAEFAKIRVGDSEVRITRGSGAALQRMAAVGSLVVVGEPGAGKSGALHDLVAELVAEGRDVVFLSVDAIAAESLGELRAELGLSRDLSDVLRGWIGTEPAFLVVDALDAARSERAARTFRDLITSTQEGGGRWRVVASIRKFDLRYSPEIQQRFAGTPDEEFKDPEFARVLHLNVPSLTDRELDQLSNQNPELRRLVREANAPFLDLLRVPFNLRLAGDLLGSGVPPDELTAIRTQLGLLDRYWLHRVIRNDRQRNAREGVLELAAKEMVRTRQLRAPRRRVATDLTTSPALEDLLSAHVLAEWQRSPAAAPEGDFLTFAHHVLFDYAVARLILRSLAADDLARHLAEQAELILAVRPSLTLHFQHLWAVDDTRFAFWSEVLTMIRAEGVPQIGKLVGPSTASEATRLADLQPLVTALREQDPAAQAVAGRTLRHLVNALLAASDPSSVLVGERAGPWCALLEVLSRNLAPSLAAAIRPLLPDLYRHSQRFTDEQRAAAGLAARRLLEYAWQQEPRDGWFVTTAMKAVCRTLESDAAESARLIRRALGPEHVARHGFEELPKLAEEVERLVTIDPKLVEDVYHAAFSYVETGRELTSMGGSILRLSSDRRQDYDMALYILKEAYADFLARAPKEALRVLDVVIDQDLREWHSSHPASEPVAEFDFGGEKARIRHDYSRLWDGKEPIGYRDPNELLSLLQTHLTRLAHNGKQVERRRAFLKALVADPRPAAIWRRVLVVAAEHPATLGQDIKKAAWAIPILLGADTTGPSCAFLRAVIGYLNAEERQRVEDALLAIPDQVPASSRDTGEEVRNRLLGCLPPTQLTSTRAKQLLADLREGDGDGSGTETLRLAPGEDPAGVVIRTLPVVAEPEWLDHRVLRQVRSFVEPTSGDTRDEHAAGIEAALQDLRAALSSAEVQHLSEHRHEQAWGRLAEACCLLASQTNFGCGDGLGAPVRSLLLEAIQYPSRAEPDGNFDGEFPMVPTGKPRAEAAEGLLRLAQHPDCADAAVLDAIERLVDDPDPAVRLQVAAKANALAIVAPELMWRALERIAANEERHGLLHLMVGGPLQAVSRLNPDRAASIARIVFERESDEEESFVKNDCIAVYLNLYLRSDHPLSQEALFAIANDAVAHPGPVGHIAWLLRETMSAGALAQADPHADAVRARAFGLLEVILDSAGEAYARVRDALARNPTMPLSDEQQRQISSIAKISEAMSRALYSGSGAYAERHRGEAAPLSEEVKRRFLREAEPVLDKLAGFGFPSTAHRFLETLGVFVPLDPIGVFRRVGKMVRASREYGYQYEELANDLVVGLVQRYIASYPAELRQDAESQGTLIEILDTFTEVGWPSALRLAYNLEQIYR